MTYSRRPACFHVNASLARIVYYRAIYTRKWVFTCTWSQVFVEHRCYFLRFSKSLWGKRI